MKKQLLFILLFIVTCDINAQLKVNSSGFIEIGTNPSSNHQFNLKGNSFFNGNMGIGVESSTLYQLNLFGNSYLNGYVGIGTEPSTIDKLKVSGSSLLDGYVKIGNESSTLDKFKVSGNSFLDGTVGIGTAPSSNYKLKLLGNSYFDGFIGIGTDYNPSYKLNLSGNCHLAGYSYLDGYVGIGALPTTNFRLNINGNSHFGGNCDFYGTNTFYNSQMELYGPQYGFTFYMEANNYYPGMYLSTGSSFNCDYVLVVDGDSYSYGQWISSDSKFKKDITNLDGNKMLSKIANINGKKYSFKSDDELTSLYKDYPTEKNAYSHKPKNLPKGERYGLVAQEIEKEFPELVKTDPKTNLKAVNYEGMIPILLESIKEQQKMILELQEKIKLINKNNKTE